MKVSLFNEFGALNSAPVFAAMHEGLANLNHTVVYHDLMADVYVIWSVLFRGRMGQNKAIWDYAMKMGIPVIVLEVGCLNRGVTWRIGLNGFNTLPQATSVRSSVLGIELSPWRQDGTDILICGQQTSSELWQHGTVKSWLATTISNIRDYSSRDIVFRPHPRETLREDLSDLDIRIDAPQKLQHSYDSFDFNRSLESAWIVINSCSSPGPQALIHGYPCVVDSTSLAFQMSTPLENIETPYYPDRTKWLEKLCHTEWLIEEIKNSTALTQILLDIENS
jgi:hypothetical protein